MKRLLLPWTCVFLFFVAYEWLYHGVIIISLYKETPWMWRPLGHLYGTWPIIVLGQMLQSFAFTYAFTKGYEAKGANEGIRYGMLIWTMFEGHYLVLYSIQPITLILLYLWLVGSCLQYVFAGIILTKVYKPSIAFVEEEIPNALQA
ncbi:hypothetical protein JNK13_03405 [bacterium]|nr:hypothetical protein [bacterium]